MRAKGVYFFGGTQGAEGNREMRDLLGGKGAGLAEMSNLGLPVPPGFTITTEICAAFNDRGGSLPPEVEGEIDEALARVEKVMGARFGDPQNPLLLSVRSGARVSMPGMMDTVLNLGLNDRTVAGLAKAADERFAYDCYRRFVQMYGDVVLGLKAEEAEEDPFEVMLEAKRKKHGVVSDTGLTGEALRELVGEFKQAIHDRLKVGFPEDPREQLSGAIGAVFRSWENTRAVAYRRINGIPDDWGTAVNVQAMVFGNMGDDSGTGVAFTRDPATGENVFYGEYLMNAQGEDVVAGIRTPQPLSRLSDKEGKGISLEEVRPAVYAELEEVRRKLEQHYRDMQDLEFTVQEGRLWILQTRSGKRTGQAAIKIAVDMVTDGLIDRSEALQRIEPEMLNHLLRPVFDRTAKEEALAAGRFLAKGLNAGPGAATGKVVFTARAAEEWAERGEHPILVRMETSPEDIKGMDASEGILTARGGMTSHAALVARQMGKVCVAGCGALEIDYAARQMKVGEHVVREGDPISLDGTGGEVISGEIPTRPSEVLRVLLERDLSPDDSESYRLYGTVMEWADEFRTLEIWTNADQPDQAETAIAFGAEGIGLCRTEHMFFGGDRIDRVRQMILAHDRAGRTEALSYLEPLQREDFKGIFRAMGHRPVTVRLLDPPLHEFLPHDEETQVKLAAKLGVPVEELRATVVKLEEFNPMLGHRGCRLGITYPEMYEMQVRAIITAAVELAREEDIRVVPEIMIPLVGEAKELKILRELTDRVAGEVCRREGVSIDYRVGTMVELPRACVTAGEIARIADFFSFGTNDLTQTVFGLSRDDAGRFLGYYVTEAKILPQDPFVTIDRNGVGALMVQAVREGRKANGSLKVGICGEHGGDPKSIEFCHDLGLAYVSCSPFRVPIARLAAAQAALRTREPVAAG